MIRRGAVIFLISASLSHLSSAQWNPPDYLRGIPVHSDCKKTEGRIGMSFQPSLLNPHGIIFLCPDRAAAIDSRHPGASFFFRVHEYGHLALGSRDEAAADAWAAEQLSYADAGRAVLLALLGHFVDIGDKFSPHYGTGFYRGANVANAAGIDRKEWPPALRAYQQKWDDRLRQNGSISFRSEHGSVFDGLLVIDGNTVGFFATLHPERSLPLPGLGPGVHKLSLRDVWSYRGDVNNKLHAGVKGLSATTSFTTSKAADAVGHISETDSELSVQVKSP
jgi:hypothetical protein